MLTPILIAGLITLAGGVVRLAYGSAVQYAVVPIRDRFDR